MNTIFFCSYKRWMVHVHLRLIVHHFLHGVHPLAPQLCGFMLKTNAASRMDRPRKHIIWKTIFTMFGYHMIYTIFSFLLHNHCFQVLFVWLSSVQTFIYTIIASHTLCFLPFWKFALRLSMLNSDLVISRVANHKKDPWIATKPWPRSQMLSKKHSNIMEFFDSTRSQQKRKKHPCDRKRMGKKAKASTIWSHCILVSNGEMEYGIFYL